MKLCYYYIDNLKFLAKGISDFQYLEYITLNLNQNKVGRTLVK